MHNAHIFGIHDTSMHTSEMHPLFHWIGKRHSTASQMFMSWIRNPQYARNNVSNCHRMDEAMDDVESANFKTTEIKIKTERKKNLYCRWPKTRIRTRNMAGFSKFGNVFIPPRASRHVSALASHTRTKITTKCPLAIFCIFNGNILFRSLMMVRRCAGWLVSFRSYIHDANSFNVCMENMVDPSHIPSLVMCIASTIMMRFNNESSPSVQQHIHTHWQSSHCFSMGYHTRPTTCHFSSWLFCVWFSLSQGVPFGYCFLINCSLVLRSVTMQPAIAIFGSAQFA